MKIFKYIIISSLLFCLSNYVSAQKQELAKDTTEQRSTLFQGMMLELDVAPFAESILINKFAKAYQAHLQVNLKNKFYPILEMGYATANKTTINNITFDTNGYFGKIGIDFPIIKSLGKKGAKQNVALGGLRFGVSQSSYSLSNQVLTDPYWGGSEVINANNLQATKFWAEGTVGVRASIYKNIFIGWNVRYKLLLNKVENGNYDPWYIPGFGVSADTAWGFSYIIGYKF